MLHVWSGLLEEYQPFVTPDKDAAFAKLKSTLKDFGFREAKANESLEEYLQAFRDFEYKYRNEYESITEEDKAENISSDSDWDTEDNELLFHQAEIEI